ncbi:MAG: hypothetical protein WDZ83_10480 [Rhizobiaceae bacterium]
MTKRFSAFDQNDQGIIAAAFFGRPSIEFVRKNLRNSAVQADAHRWQNLANRFMTIITRCNSDSSEAARRIAIDLFVVEALTDSRHGILTAERSFPIDATKIANGSLDYLISSIEYEGDIILFPSIVIEAKKKNGQMARALWQLLAELARMYQDYGTAYQSMPQFLRGIVTDGRFWQFIEVDTVGGVVYQTDDLDIMNGTGNDINPSEHFPKVAAELCHWFGNYSQTTTSIFRT